MLKRVLHISIIAIALIAVAALRTFAQKPFVRDFAVSESAVNSKVNAIAQDSIGYLWLGTDNGLFCFNGRNFVKYPDSVNKPVTAIAISHRQIWVGYNNGKIGNVVNTSIRPVAITSGPSSSITSLYATAPGILLASTEEQGIFMITNNRGVALNTANGLSDNFTYGVAVNTNNNILAGSDKGINDITISQGKFSVQAYTTRQGLPDDIVTVVKTIPGSHSWWIGTQEGGIAIYNQDSRRVAAILPVGSKWAYGQVNDILPVSATRAWVATEDGWLLELETAGAAPIVMRPYHYEGKVFKKLLLDRAGNIWCGTTQGLTMMTGEYLSALRLPAPYSLQDITAMAWNNDILWIALKKDLYQIYLKDTLLHMAKVYSVKANITSLYNDKDGRLWIGTLGDGLYYQENKSAIKKVTGVEDLDNSGNILNITGAGNSIWVSGLKGVDELSLPVDGKVQLLRHHGKKTGIGSDYVYQLYPDYKGNIWMATDGAGVCMYDGTGYHNWDTVFSAGGKVAYSLAEDASGDMWAGTMPKDLFVFHDNEWKNLRAPETQYADVSISSVIANATGQVVSVYQRCIDEWYPKSHYFRHFNSALGIGIDSTSNVLNCVAKDKAGNVFVPYQQGILIFSNQQNGYDIRPTVHIANPMIFSRPVSFGKHNFDYDENYVSFTFDGIGFVNRERLNYRYMLEGYNDGWIYTNDASVSFPKLPAGNYKFRVQVSLNPAFEHPNEDVYAFTIATPFWKTDLFYITAFLLSVLLGYSYIKVREKRLQRISQLQQERMLFEYEHLKSQVNPHFLFNSLYALSILIEDEKEKAIDYTVHLADLYRSMLSSGRQDTIPIKEELAILNNYITIQQTRFAEAFKVVIDIPEEVKEEKKIVPLALQLLVENAIKHNVVSTTHPLTIYITTTKDEIIIKNVLQPKMSKEKGEGIGLVNIKKRYGLLTKKPITYGIFGNEYVIILPLL